MFQFFNPPSYQSRNLLPSPSKSTQQPVDIPPTQKDKRSKHRQIKAPQHYKQHHPHLKEDNKHNNINNHTSLSTSSNYSSPISNLDSVSSYPFPSSLNSNTFSIVSSKPSNTPFLTRIRKYFHLTMISLSHSSPFSSSYHTFTNSPAWLLGTCYSISRKQQQQLQELQDEFNEDQSNLMSVSDSNVSVNHSVFVSCPSFSNFRDELLSHFHSLLWFSYRSNFSAISPLFHHISSDAGWGCMLRSTQMIIANVFIRHYMGREWRIKTNKSNKSNNQNNLSTSTPSSLTSSSSLSASDIEIVESAMANESIYLTLISWFLDSSASPYSIHSLLTSTQSKESPNTTNNPLPVGEWLGPSSTCHMLLRCRNSHVISAGGEDAIDIPLIIVTDDQTIYWETVIKTVCKRTSNITNSNNKMPELPQTLPTPPKPNNNYTDIDTSVTSPTTTTDTASAIAGVVDNNIDMILEELFRPFLVLIPVRLGIDKINLNYLPSLFECFRLASSVGVIGGRPRSAYYFIGCQDDKIFYLDPHSVQSSLHHSSELLNPKIRSTYQPSNIYSLQGNQLDPTLAIGFYFNQWKEFKQFWLTSTILEEKYNKYSVFRVREKKSWQHQEDREPVDIISPQSIQEPNLNRSTSQSSNSEMQIEIQTIEEKEVNQNSSINRTKSTYDNNNNNNNFKGEGVPTDAEYKNIKGGNTTGLIASREYNKNKDASDDEDYDGDDDKVDENDDENDFVLV